MAALMWSVAKRLSKPVCEGDKNHALMCTSPQVPSLVPYNIIIPSPFLPYHAQLQYFGAACRTWRVNDGEVRAVLVLNSNHDVGGIKAAFVSQANVLGLYEFLEVLQRLFLKPAFSAQRADRIFCVSFIDHLNRDRPSGLGPSSNMIELKAHKSLDESCKQAHT